MNFLVRIKKFTDTKIFIYLFLSKFIRNIFLNILFAFPFFRSEIIQLPYNVPLKYVNLISAMKIDIFQNKD